MRIDIADEKIAAIQWGVVIGASLLAAVFDLRTRRIPNAITGPLLLTGLVQAVWIGGLAGLADSVGACVVLALPYIVMFLFAYGGAGDAKFMGAAGAWLGLKQGVIALFCVAAAGVVIAVARAIARKRLRFVMGNIFVSVCTFLLTGHGMAQNKPGQTGPDETGALIIPYGVAMFAGVCVGGLFVLLW